MSGGPQNGILEKKNCCWKIILVKFIYNNLNLNRDKINCFGIETDSGKSQIRGAM